MDNNNKPVTSIVENYYIPCDGRRLTPEEAIINVDKIDKMLRDRFPDWDESVFESLRIHGLECANRAL